MTDRELLENRLADLEQQFSSLTQNLVDVHKALVEVKQRLDSLSLPPASKGSKTNKG